MQWKSNKYYIFWVCVCILTLVIQHAMRMRSIILSSVACPALPCFPISYAALFFRKKKVIEHILRVLIFSKKFLWNISHSKQNSVRFQFSAALRFYGALIGSFGTIYRSHVFFFFFWNLKMGPLGCTEMPGNILPINAAQNSRSQKSSAGYCRKRFTCIFMYSIRYSWLFQ
jgi:hypothetical protein